LVFRIYIDPKIAAQAAKILLKLYRAFWECDASLIEINPLVVTSQGEVWAVDAKFNEDDNALFRQSWIAEMRDRQAEIPEELEAREKGLSFVKLDGTVGCVVNGAGLAMGTMDLIKHYGGEPANFLDIGGSSSPEKVTAAMRILLRDANVKVVLFNIFGGITRCDDVANGLVSAIKEVGVDLPIVIRLTGTNADEGKEILRRNDLVAVDSMEEVVQKAVQMAGA
jgi:succinyl-CoA synthetase beta subunit